MNLSQIRTSFETLSGERGLGSATETSLVNDACALLEVRSPTGLRTWNREVVKNEAVLMVPRAYQIRGVTRVDDATGVTEAPYLLKQNQLRSSFLQAFLLSPYQDILTNGEFASDPDVDSSWTASGGDFDGSDDIYWRSDKQALQVEANASSRTITQTLTHAEGEENYRISWYVDTLWDYDGESDPTITFDVGGETSSTIITNDMSGWQYNDIVLPEEEKLGAGNGLFDLTITFSPTVNVRISRIDMRRTSGVSTDYVGKPAYFCEIERAGDALPTDEQDRSRGVDRVGKQLFVWPVPDGFYTMRVLGKFYPEELSADSDTNFWTLSHDMMVVVAMQLELARIRGEGRLAQDFRIQLDGMLETRDRAIAAFRSGTSGRVGFRGGAR